MTLQRYKLLKFWAQSFLVGVPKIICGFRDDDGNLKKITPYETLKIPSIVREKPNTWVCFTLKLAYLFIKLLIYYDDLGS
jgi:RAT1-interacting protein